MPRLPPPLDAPYPLALEAAAAYRRDGHVTVRSLASRDELDFYRPAIAAVVDEVSRRGDAQGRIDDYSRLFTQVTNAWRLDETVRRFVFASRFARVAAELMGLPAVRLYHDQALIKEKGGGPTPWHQDQTYWPLATDHTITMWMALVDVSAEMGPMTFATGSHRGDRPPPEVISDASDLRLARHIAERGLAIGGGGPLAAGDATFHSGWTIHAAGGNASARRREVMTVIYVADGARVSRLDSEHRRADQEAFLPGLAPGDLAATELNPILYRRE